MENPENVDPPDHLGLLGIPKPRRLIIPEAAVTPEVELAAALISGGTKPEGDNV